MDVYLPTEVEFEINSRRLFHSHLGLVQWWRTVLHCESLNFLRGLNYLSLTYVETFQGEWDIKFQITDLHVNFLRVNRFTTSSIIIAHLNWKKVSLKVIWCLTMSVFNPLAWPGVNWQQYLLKDSPKQSELRECTHVYVDVYAHSLSLTRTRIQRLRSGMFTLRSRHGYSFWSLLMKYSTWNILCLLSWGSGGTGIRGGLIKPSVCHPWLLCKTLMDWSKEE